LNDFSLPLRLKLIVKSSISKESKREEVNGSSYVILEPTIRVQTVSSQLQSMMNMLIAATLLLHLFTARAPIHEMGRQQQYLMSKEEVR
jgi:hypothetical protein